MKSNIRTIVEAVANAYGDDFFNSITLSLHKAIGADYTFIALLDKEALVSKTIALVTKGNLAENIEYALANTPCAIITDDSICCYKSQVCAHFPKAQLLIDMKIEAYIGAPLYDSKQKLMGLIVALYKQPLEEEIDAVTLFQVFSGRISAELERRNYETLLEEKLLSRTLALSTTTEQLQQVQQQLVESEKMAALGALIAGITHEVNTPLGIAITTHSIISDEQKQLNDKIANERLSMKDMEHYIQAVNNALTMQGENLIRAKQLIENFKKTAVDQQILEVETINIKDYYSKVLSTLNSILKTKKASLTITGDNYINLATYPGVHAQILTNLITNSIRHGFISIEDNHIIINITQQEHFVEVNYQDNGIGLSEEAKKRVFEPFYTTAKKSGGIGLGMSIVYNLITQKLNGQIFIDKNSSGAGFIYQFKAHKEQ